jgi:hypothetical protein
MEGPMTTESDQHPTFRELDSEIVNQINKLAALVQQQRAYPLADKDAQRTTLHKLENDLSACWAQRRELRVSTHYRPILPVEAATPVEVGTPMEVATSIEVGPPSESAPAES